jgi:hypothetical protein
VRLGARSRGARADIHFIMIIKTINMIVHFKYDSTLSDFTKHRR